MATTRLLKGLGFGFALWLCIGLLLSLKLLAARPMASAKKLIEFGWDVPNPAFVQRNIRQMETQPFDGLVMRLGAADRGPISNKNGITVFRHQAYKSGDFAQDLAALRRIQFQKFTDNFLLLWSTTDPSWDWFSSSDWQAAEANIRLLARAARIGHCLGIAFDPEVYQDSVQLWNYGQLVRTNSKPFGEYEQQVRQRGAQFIRSLQAEFPEIRVLSLFQLSVFKNLFNAPIPAAAVLPGHPFSLLPAFVNGMLDAAKPGSVLIDGNASAYYYEESTSFSQAKYLIRQRLNSLVAPENRATYARQVQVGNAIYVDELLGLRPLEARSLSHHLSPTEQRQWLEHNTYYALQMADTYAWVYSEQMNWWLNQLPAGAKSAIATARRKVQTRQPLGFEISKALQRAKQKLFNSLTDIQNSYA